MSSTHNTPQDILYLAMVVWGLFLSYLLVNRLREGRFNKARRARVERRRPRPGAAWHD